MKMEKDIDNPAVIRTVTGDISPKSLGVTSCHEHVICDISAPHNHESNNYKTLKYGIDSAPTQGSLYSIENLYWIRENHLEASDNRGLFSVEDAVTELQHFRNSGGNSIIDVTCEGIGRNPKAVKEVSTRAGVQIVLGCSHYVASYQSSFVREMDIETMAGQITRDITVGINDSDVRAGVIGEIGCSWPVEREEHKVLQASALAHKETGAAVIVHPGRDVKAPLSHAIELMDLGVDPARITIAHIDRRITKLVDILDLAQVGCYLSFDCFGLEPWISAETRKMPMPSDLQRMDLITALFSHGHGSKVVLGCDIAMKHRLRKFGGHGYDYLLRWVVPTFFARTELGREEIDQMMVTNPMNAYSFLPRNVHSKIQKVV